MIIILFQELLQNKDFRIRLSSFLSAKKGNNETIKQ